MDNKDMPISPIVNNDGFTTSAENVLDKEAGAIGLTKREYFAGLAMQGLLAGDVGSDYSYDGAARDAVEHADALLKALESEG